MGASSGWVGAEWGRRAGTGGIWCKSAVTMGNRNGDIRGKSGITSGWELIWGGRGVGGCRSPSVWIPGGPRFCRGWSRSRCPPIPPLASPPPSCARRFPAERGRARRRYGVNEGSRGPAGPAAPRPRLLSPGIGEQDRGFCRCWHLQPRSGTRAGAAIWEPVEGGRGSVGYPRGGGCLGLGGCPGAPPCSRGGQCDV